MLILKHCDLQPGDILFVVSKSNNLLVRFKQALQAVSTPSRKHGHMEVVSVFVCTGGDGSADSFGYQFHNYERQLKTSENAFLDKLYDKPLEDLPSILQSYCARKELPATKVKEELSKSSFKWTKELSHQITTEDTPLQLLEKMVQSSKMNEDVPLEERDAERRAKIIELILFCWKTSGHSEILPSTNSSLLAFRHTDPTVRSKFLAEYMKQIEISKAFAAKGKNRTSVWNLFLSLFSSAKQDKQDRDQNLAPSDATFCAQHVIQVLNKVDPNLVARGRFVTPKSLEAGLRDACKPKVPHETVTLEVPENASVEDDFEVMLKALEKTNPLPAFKLNILPASGEMLIKDMADAVENEIRRIRNKWWLSTKDLQKAMDLEKKLLPFRELQLKKYPISMQVEATLEFLHNTMPILQQKTGWFGSWIRATAYSTIRSFARTQGIFDGDLREYALRVNKKSDPVIPALVSEKSDVTSKPENQRNFLFSDWSFSGWNLEKRAYMIKHMEQLLDSGHAIYLWNGKEKKLIPCANKLFLQQIIGMKDFDNLWGDKIEPINRQQLSKQALLQTLDVKTIDILDYQACNLLTQQKPAYAEDINKASRLFASSFTPRGIQQAKLAILAVEIDNSLKDKISLNQLTQLKKQIEKETVNNNKYKSGIDTQPQILSTKNKKIVFKPVNILGLTPSSKYYRKDVYPYLKINKKPSSSFDFYELNMKGLERDLKTIYYAFHPNDVLDGCIKNRKHEVQGTLYLAQDTLTLTNQWQSLPSLCRGEKITDLSVQGLDAKDFEIRYSSKVGLHFIRHKKADSGSYPLSLKWLQEMPKEFSVFPSFNTLTPMPQYPEIHSLLMKYYTFGKDKGELGQAVEAGKIRTGFEYIAEAQRLRTGSCRLRSIAFKEELNRLYPEIPVHININDEHCFIEMAIEGQWQRYCLGGYSNAPTLANDIKSDCDKSLEWCKDVAHSATNHSFFKSDTVDGQDTKELTPRFKP